MRSFKGISKPTVHRPTTNCISFISGCRKQRGFLKLALIAVITVSIIHPSHAFFFPKSFFRKGSADNANLPNQQHPRVLPQSANNGNHYGGDSLQGSGTDIQPALRIVNRPPPPRYRDQAQEPSGPIPGSGFHVPKELCLACERFPWMPVAGGERAPSAAASANIGVSQLHSQQTFAQGGQNALPAKTIVINALGEAQGPVPIPPNLPSRRPFAIQFDGSQSGNKLNEQTRHPQNHDAPTASQGNQGQSAPERPVTFQIFQAQTPNIQNSPSPNPPPRNPPKPAIVQPQPPQQIYGRPTILHPATSLPPPPSNPNLKAPPTQHSNFPPPPNPMTVGTIIAAQQNNVAIPQFQKVEQAKLVYQEHFTSQHPPSPQNFKVPIISQPPTPLKPVQTGNGHETNSISSPPITSQQNYGAPPQSHGYSPAQGLFLQMRPPAPYRMHPQPSPNMKPPGVMVYYGKPIRLATNIAQQRPLGQVHFPPPQAFLQMAPPPPPPQPPAPVPNFQQGVQANTLYGSPRPENQGHVHDNGNRLQEESRPAPSGQVLNILQPQNGPPKEQILQENSIQPVPIPVPTIQNPNTHQVSNPNRPAFTQETGWEIIPSIQTDLTHLFSEGKQKQKSQGGNELPVPVPIPVPQTHPPKSSVFIVAGANGQNNHNQQQYPNIKVQDVTYHEESGNPIPSGSSSLNTLNQNNLQDLREKNQYNAVQNISSQPNEHYKLVQQHQQQQQQLFQLSQKPQHPIIQQQIIRPKPFILGVPTSPIRPIIFRPRPQHNYEPLNPSIMTALNHAQQTSLLTHQYLSQSNVGKPVQENTIYVSPIGPLVPNVQTRQPTGGLITGASATNYLQETDNQQRENTDIDPRIPINRPTTLTEDVNCQTNNQFLIPITTHQQQQHQQQQPQLEFQESKDIVSSEPTQQEPEQKVSSVDQSISSSNSTSENDDQSSSTGSARDNVHEDDASPTPTAQSTEDSLPPINTDPVYQTSSTGVDNSQYGIRGSINVADNGNKGSYMIYYPRPVSKSPVYWIQPSRTLSQGVVRLSPHITPTTPSVASTLVSWSRPRVVVANQYRTQPYKPEQDSVQEGRAEEESYEREESVDNVKEEHDTSENESSDVDHVHDEQIPYGQRLVVSRDKVNGQTPYDIISVTGSDDEAQSLESNSFNGNSQGEESAEEYQHQNEPELTASSNDELSNPNNSNENDDGATGPDTSSYGENLTSEDRKQLQPENNLQSVNQETQASTNDDIDDADDERDDFNFRPQTNFRKPISTTIIHSPGESSFHSEKLPNFKPHRVIVHDFTTSSANSAATGPSASESQGNLDGSESQEVPASESVPDSWKVSQKLKAPKFVKDGEDSSQSIHRPQGLSIQEVISSGPETTADCISTAHSGHLLSSHASTSPRSSDSSVVTSSSAKGRDIQLPLGSRFPGGRPSIFTAFRRPISVTSAVSSTPPAFTTFSNLSEREEGRITPTKDNKRDGYFGQSPSGFAASIAVPVYRRPSVKQRPTDFLNQNEHIRSSSESTTTATYVRPQTNKILSAEDIYQNSEVKENNRIENGNDPIISVESTTTSASAPAASSEIDSIDEIMSTEKSSSFSVSVVDDQSGSSGLSGNEDERPRSVASNHLQQVEEWPSKVNIVHVTSIPVVNDVETITTTTGASFSSASDSVVTSTTAIPSPASTSTKIVKTVRVRQRMRSGSFNGPLRSRFHGAGRVRVVHRPANQEYIRHFPEFSTQEGDKLAREEEQEVKNAIIELKKSPESIKTH